MPPTFNIPSLCIQGALNYEFQNVRVPCPHPELNDSNSSGSASTYSSIVRAYDWFVFSFLSVNTANDLVVVKRSRHLSTSRDAISSVQFYLKQLRNGNNLQMVCGGSSRMYSVKCDLVQGKDVRTLSERYKVLDQREHKILEGVVL